MTTEKKTGTDILLTIVAFIWGSLSPICLGLGLFFMAFYDSPIDPQAGMGLVDNLLIVSVLSFPIFCILSSLGIVFLKKRSKAAATIVALLPIIPLIPIFAIFNSSSSGTPEDNRDVVQVSECVSPIFDGGDGLDTTGCGALQFGMRGSGTISTTSEVHHWQFSTESTQVKITVKNDGNSCPQLIVLDSDGQIVDGFEDENSLQLCPSGMITTGFFQFHAPKTGSYIIRVFSPETPGTYWVSIE